MRHLNSGRQIHIDQVRISRVIGFVNKHYSDPISLESAARIAGLERTYFSKFFRRQIGIGYQRWLQKYRVRRAIDLMRHRKLSITAIAFAVGFSDLRTFERAFRKVTGACPRDIRRSLTNEMERNEITSTNAEPSTKKRCIGGPSPLPPDR